MLLTQLRKDAIYEFFKENQYGNEKARMGSEEYFEIWKKARHESVEKWIVGGGVEVLESLNVDEVIVGAISDGNADPRNVQCLNKYFDFCINSESIGVSKPNPLVYQAAMSHVSSLINSESNWRDKPGKRKTCYGPMGWTHVGDDFVKDILGAKACGMRTIWCRELLPNHSKQKEINITNEFSVMEYADVIVDRFVDISGVLRGW